MIRSLGPSSRRKGSWALKEEKGTNFFSTLCCFSHIKMLFLKLWVVRTKVCRTNFLYMLSHSVLSNSFQPQGLQPARLLCPWRFSRQEYWRGSPCPSPGDLPNPGTEPRSPALQADSLPSEPQGSPIFL